MDATVSALAIAQVWQVTALIVIVAVINRWLAPRRPHLAHVLWVVVLLKCVTPPLWNSTSGVFCWLQPQQVVATAPPIDVEWQPVEWQELLVLDAAPTEPASEQWDASAAVPLSDEAAAQFFAEPEPAGWQVDWPTTLSAAWLATVACVVLLFLVRWLRFWRRVQRTPQRACPELEALVADLARQLGVKRVRLLVTESRIGPAVVGLFRKTILLPAVVADRLGHSTGCVVGSEKKENESDDESSHSKGLVPILAHELLHVRRGDLWVGLLQTLAQAVWWFHPLVWWVGRLTNREAERCCDEEVLAELNCDPATYARSLLDVLELKSQLAPVPVFPGVRPVDVTSKRLERIMTLGQGCRRRTPWWCWLIAVGAAALTLPGAAFVVRAQEEPQDLRPAPDAFPAPVADGVPAAQPGSITRAVDHPNGGTTVSTVVYEAAGFAHLLTGSEAERREKFERLVESRDPAGNAQVTWFEDKPVVRAVGAAHKAVRACLALLADSKATPQKFDEFLDSVTRQSQSGVVIDLQVVTMNADSYSDVEDAVLDLADQHGGDESPFVIPAEKWDALHEAVPHDDAWHYVAPQLAVLNGRTVHVESVAQYPPVSIHTTSPYRTHGGLVGEPDWTGWKATALPFIRDDGSYWLGMQLDVRSLLNNKADPLKADNSNLQVRRHQFGFATTLRDGEVFVLPGMNVNYGHVKSDTASTFLAVRIGKLPPAPDAGALPNLQADPVPRRIAGTGINSAAGVVGEFQADTVRQVSAAADAAAAPAPLKPRTLTKRSFGDWLATLEVVPDNAAAEQVRLMLTDNSDVLVALATASNVSIRQTPDTLTLELTDALLRMFSTPQQTVTARTLQLISGHTDEDSDTNVIRLKATSATCDLKTADSMSSLKAEQIEVTLNPQTLGVEQIKAEKLESLRQTPPGSHRTQATLRRKTNSNQHVLDRTVDVSFADTSLRDAMQTLARQHDINIVVDENGLAEVGVATDESISLEVSQISLRSALKLMLEPRNLGTKIGDDKVIIVTSLERLAGSPVTMAYPVADLVIPVPDPAVIRPGNGGGTAAADSENSSSDQHPVSADAKSVKANAEQLIKLIQSTVSPNSWDIVGGNGRIAAFHESNLSLVIYQSQQVHAEISDLLGQLRQLQDLQVTLEVESLAVPPSFLTEWNVDLQFQPLGESKTQRFMKLSKEQAAQLRNGSTVGTFPKATVFNGRHSAWGFGEFDGRQPRLNVRAVASSDRRNVRLGVSVDDFQTRFAGQESLAAIPAIPDGEAVLLELPDLTEALAAGEPRAGVPIPGRRKLFRAVPPPRRFVLIQPRVVIVEEEEELLGVEP